MGFSRERGAWEVVCEEYLRVAKKRRGEGVRVGRDKDPEVIVRESLDLEGKGGEGASLSTLWVGEGLQAVSNRKPLGKNRWTELC